MTVLSTCSYGSVRNYAPPRQYSKKNFKRSTICHVTNLGEEDEKLREPKKIRVTEQFMRDGVPLRDQVKESMLDAVGDESINLDDMEYWFRDNPEDIREEKFLEPLEEIPNETFTLQNDSWESAPIDTLHPGDIKVAEIYGIHLYHGAVVDLGTEFHGLIPVTEEQWPRVLHLLKLDTEVKVRIHAVRDPKHFRFPVQLEVIEPDCSEFLTPAQEWVPPMVIGPDINVMEAVRASGRDYTASSFIPDEPEEEHDPIMDKIRLRDKYGPSAEYPLDQRAELGELDEEEQEIWDAYESADQEGGIMDIDTLLAEEAASKHLSRMECMMAGGPAYGYITDSDEELDF